MHDINKLFVFKAEFILDRNRFFLSHCRMSVFEVTVHSLQFNTHDSKKKKKKKKKKRKKERTCDNAIKKNRLRSSMNSALMCDK